MESIGESTKNMNELIEIGQKLMENSTYGDMTTLKRTLDNAFRQKETEFQGMKQKEGESILPMTVELGKAVDNLIVQVTEASARGEKMDLDSPGNVLVIQDFTRACGSPGSYYLHRKENGIELRRKVKELETKRVDLLTKMTYDLTSGKMLKTECRLWLANVENIIRGAEDLDKKLAEGRFVEYEVSGRSLMGKIEEVDELYRKGNFAESLVVEENAGEKCQSSNLSKTKNKSSSGVANEGGKISIVGIGGVGETSIENKSSVTMTFGDIQL